MKDDYTYVNYNTQSESVASERLVKYESKHTNTFFSDFQILLNDKLKVVAAIQDGLPNSYYKELLIHMPLTESRWASILNVSIKSLRRYNEGDHIFKPIHSEKLIEMTEVTLQGLETFGDQSKLNLWLNTPSMAFEGITPVDLLSDSYGKDLVMEELIKIDHGIFS